MHDKQGRGTGSAASPTATYRRDQLAEAAATISEPTHEPAQRFTGRQQLGVRVYRGNNDQILGNLFGVPAERITPRRTADMKIIEQRDRGPTDLPDRHHHQQTTSPTPPRCTGPSVVDRRREQQRGLRVGIDLRAARGGGARRPAGGRPRSGQTSSASSRPSVPTTSGAAPTDQPSGQAQRRDDQRAGSRPADHNFIAATRSE